MATNGNEQKGLNNDKNRGAQTADKAVMNATVVGAQQNMNITDIKQNAPGDTHRPGAKDAEAVNYALPARYINNTNDGLNDTRVMGKKHYLNNPNNGNVHLAYAYAALIDDATRHVTKPGLLGAATVRAVEHAGIMTGP